MRITTIPEKHIARFNSCGEPQENGCIIWTGPIVPPKGYGRFHFAADGKQLAEGAHRVSYRIHKGPIPDGMLVCHHCDNPPCINPDHLFLGTPKQNTDDMVKKGRNPWAIVSGAKLTEEDVLFIRSSSLDKHEIAKIFSIHPDTAKRIRSGQLWKRLLPDNQPVAP